MNKVEILCPNGRRVTVKTTANTKIVQILDEVCAKQGYQSSEYDLKHGRKVLDVTLSVQFAAIPNLAKLELVKASQTRADTPVVIALQTSEGARYTREFLPSKSLWSILESFEENDGSGGQAKLICYSRKTTSLHPVCQYLKDEALGEYALRETSLRQLGLTSGRAAIRHYFKEVSDADLDDIRRNVDAEKQRKEKLAAMASEAVLQQSANQSQHTAAGQSERSTAVQSQQTTEESQCIELRGSGVMSAHTGRQVTDAQPMDIDEVEVKSGSGLTGVKRQPDDSHTTNHTQDNTQAVSRVNPTQSTSEYSWQPYQPFADFKFPEATKGKEVYNNELSVFKKEDCQACDRELVVYNISQVASLQDIPVDEVADDFFEVTVSDVRMMFTDLQKRVSDYSDQPLVTQALKRSEMEAKMLARYPHVIIRVQFPDGFVVQGIFRPLETVFALHKFVKELLHDQGLDFYLYTTPPKTVLKDFTATLIEASLVPMTRVFFGLPFKCEKYLSDDVTTKLSDKIAAETIINKYLSQSRSAARCTSAVAGGTPGSSGASGTGKTATSNAASNVPKWFKMSK